MEILSFFAEIIIANLKYKTGNFRRLFLCFNEIGYQDSVLISGFSFRKSVSVS